MMATDPMNFIVNTVYVDTFTLTAGFMMVTSCNYPEAYLTPVVQMDGLVMESSDLDSVVDFRPMHMYYSGPGNITGNGWNMTRTYNLGTLGTFNYVFTVTETCLPDDAALVTISLDTLSLAILNNADISRTNVLAMDISLVGTRYHKVSLNNIQVEDYYDTTYGGIGVAGKPTDEVIVSNVVIQNHYTTLGIFYNIGVGKIGVGVLGFSCE